MVRAILASLLALAPVAAQVKYNTVDILPSGGNVGQVCFYETAANGANKVCLVAPSLLGGDSTLDVSTISNLWSKSGTELSPATSGDSILFSAATGPKIVLFAASTSAKHGFSIATNTLQVHKAFNTDKISFGYGRSGAYTEQASIDDIYLDIGDLYLRGSVSNRIAVADDIIPTSSNTRSLGFAGLGLYFKDIALRGRAIFSDGMTDGGIQMNAGVLECSNDLMSWTACAGGGSLPVVDTTGISKGSSDATKIVRFEVDGFTAGTTRVLTPPDANITIAGIDLLQTWSAGQNFAAITAAQIGVSTGFFVDAAGNTEVLSLDINGNVAFNSSRVWVGGNLTFGTDSTYSVGGTTSGRPSNFYAGGGGFHAYSGTTLRALMDISNFALYNGSAVNKYVIDTSTGNTTSSGYNSSTSYQVSGTEVISSSRVGKFVSLDINGTANVIDSSRNASINNLTIAGTCTGSACGVAPPVTDTTGISKGSSDATKIVRFEVDGFTTGTTRVLTPPNANITIAGIDLLQTWSAGQNFAAITATQIGVSTGFFVDGSGNTEVLSLEVNGTNTINSSRAWVAGNLLFGTDSTYSVGATTSGRPASYYAGGGGFYAYSGSTLRAFMDVSNFALYNGAAVNKYVIDTSTGNTTSAGYNSSASYQVSGTEVVSSGRVGKFVSLDINGTTDRINSSGVFNAASYSVAGTSVVDSSRNASFVSLTINGTSAINSSRNTNFNNLVWTNQLWGPFTADTGLSFASSAGKIAYYDTSGVFKGWIPVLP